MILSEDEDSPVERLQQVFAHILATRMQDVPILNRSLHVEAVGFRLWQGRWIGVLVTPWMINLVLLPGPDLALQVLRLDEKQNWEFPSGSYEFMGLNEAELGTCHICPLISPVDEFASHEQAITVAQKIVTELFAEEKTEHAHEHQLTDMLEQTRLQGESLANKPVSRRDFLRAPFVGR